MNKIGYWAVMGFLSFLLATCVLGLTMECVAVWNEAYAAMFGIE